MYVYAFSFVCVNTKVLKLGMKILTQCTINCKMVNTLLIIIDDILYYCFQKTYPCTC